MTEPLPPDRDAEQEVDFGRLGGAIVARWWLLVGGLVAGVVLGYLAAAGGSTAYTASSTLYLGQPLTPNGGGLLQTLATNPSTVRVVTHAEDTIRRVAAATGMTTRQLRNGITVTAVSGVLQQKAGQTPLVADLRPRPLAAQDGRRGRPARQHLVPDGLGLRRHEDHDPRGAAQAEPGRAGHDRRGARRRPAGRRERHAPPTGSRSSPRSRSPSSGAAASSRTSSRTSSSSRSRGTSRRATSSRTRPR